MGGDVLRRRPVPEGRPQLGAPAPVQVDDRLRAFEPQAPNRGAGEHDACRSQVLHPQGEVAEATVGQRVVDANGPAGGVDQAVEAHRVRQGVACLREHGPQCVLLTPGPVEVAAASVPVVGASARVSVPISRNVVASEGAGRVAAGMPANAAGTRDTLFPSRSVST
jgi:hypothetical protein